MKQERLYDVILGSFVSEKTNANYENNRTVVLKVDNLATKTEIKKAVELCLDVQVEKVQTCIVKGKRKQFRQIEGRRKNWKKAYVVLKEGSKLDLMKAE